MTRVLVVDDSPTQATEIKLILQESGMDTQTAGDATSALDRLQRERFDLVLSDIVMPGPDGYELCRRIKGTWPELPVILLTTLSDPVEVVRALECGADNFLTKPCEPEHLVARVSGVLDGLRQRQESNGEAVTIPFLGERFAITASREQVLGLLLSTFEDTVRKNHELVAAKAELSAKHEDLLRLESQKEELSALLVHDLRSPAAGIMMSAQAQLRDRSLTENERNTWKNVFAAAEMISRMVMNLLDIAKGDDQVFTPRMADVDVNALLSNVGELMAPLASGREQRLSVELPSQPTAVLGDRELLRRVLQNLIDNAIRHSPAGGTVQVDTAIDEAESMLFVRVRDEGTGVPAELRTRIFDKFVRAERGSQEEFGKGLGLAFCRMAIEAHGGQIWVEDNEPKGSVFIARLPLGREA